MTAKRLPRPRDPVQLGKLIGDILTGQVEDHAPARPEDLNKDQAAVALGRKGGLKGHEIVAEIGKKYWPGVEGRQILPPIYSFTKKGRLIKNDDGIFRLVQKETAGD